MTAVCTEGGTDLCASDPCAIVERPVCLPCRRKSDRNSAQGESFAQQLPPEIWAKVFAHLLPDHNPCDGDYYVEAKSSSSLAAALLKNQSSLYQLKLVCKKFNQVFTLHSELSDTVFWGSGKGNQVAPSIFLWLQRWRDSIKRVFIVSGGSYQDMALAALTSAASQLRAIALTDAPARVVQLLAAFMSLQRCDLHDLQHPPDSPQGLQALQALPSLQSLNLSCGEFKDVHISGRMAHLSVRTAKLMSFCKVGSITLESLRIFDASLRGLHSEGLAGCACLKLLDAEDCTVYASNPLHTLDLDSSAAPRIPANLMDLTQLKSLKIHLEAVDARRCDVSWMYNLVSLEALDLNVLGATKIENALSQLTALTRLAVSTTVNQSNCCGQAVFSVDWSALLALQVLQISGPTSFGGLILRLTDIKCLRVLELSQLHAGGLTTTMLATLFYHLAANCPHVKVKIDGIGLCSRIGWILGAYR